MPFEPLAARAGFVHVCAHRGHSIGAPENTISALEAAAAHGATVCEIDIVLSRDDEVVLLHDEILDRTTNGRGAAGSFTLAELQRLDAGAWFDPAFAGIRIPTLAEALAAARALGLGLLVEIKERRRTELLIERLGDLLATEGAHDDLLVISFDHPSLQHVRARNPQARTELITHARHVDPVALAARAGAASVAIEWDMFAPDDARALHEAGVAVRVTIPRPDRLARRRDYCLGIEDRLAAALSEGLIDILAGDDTRQVAAFVQASGRGRGPDRHAPVIRAAEYGASP